MFCSKCGSPNAEDDRFCSQCNNPLQNTTGAVAASPTPPTAYPGNRPQMTVPTSITVQIPSGDDLAPTLMLWTGHALAVLGWIFAIILWVKSGKPLMADIPMGASMGNPLKGLQIGLGFLSFIAGHVLQIVFFWASELLKAVRAKS